MSKTLTLKGRRKDSRGVARWHDSYRLQTALDNIIAGTPVARCGVWFGLSRKVQLGQVGAGIDESPNAEIALELEDGEAKMLWDALMKLPPEGYRKHAVTGRPEVPDSATLYDMLEDWGEQLGMEFSD